MDPRAAFVYRSASMNLLRVSHGFLRAMAAAFYYVGGIGLSFNAWRYLRAGAEGYGVGWAAAAGVVGVVLGLVRGRTLFTRACRRNLRRIYAIEEPRPWQFFRPAFFGALVLMIIVGRTLGGVATGSPRAALVVAALELTIAIGLLTGSREFWRFRGQESDLRSRKVLRSEI